MPFVVLVFVLVRFSEELRFDRLVAGCDRFHDGDSQLGFQLESGSHVLVVRFLDFDGVERESVVEDVLGYVGACVGVAARKCFELLLLVIIDMDMEFHCLDDVRHVPLSFLRAGIYSLCIIYHVI